MYWRCSFGFFLCAQIMLTKVMVHVIVNAAPPAAEMIIIIDISSLSLLLVVDNRPQDWSEVHDLFTAIGAVLLSINVDAVVIGKCDVALYAIVVGKDVTVGVDAVELVVGNIVFIIVFIVVFVVVFIVVFVVVFVAVYLVNGEFVFNVVFPTVPNKPL